MFVHRVVKEYESELKENKEMGGGLFHRGHPYDVLLPPCVPPAPAPPGNVVNGNVNVIHHNSWNSGDGNAFGISVTGGRRERSGGMAVDAGAGLNVGDGTIMARSVRGDVCGNPDSGYHRGYGNTLEPAMGVGMIFDGGHGNNLNRNVNDGVVADGDGYIDGPSGSLCAAVNGRRAGNGIIFGGSCGGTLTGGRMMGNCMAFKGCQSDTICTQNDGDALSIGPVACDGCGGNVKFCICNSIKDKKTKPKVRREAREIYRDMLRSLTRCWYGNNLSFTLLQNDDFRHWFGFMIEYYDAVGIPAPLPTNRKLSHGIFQCEYNQMFKAVNDVLSTVGVIQSSQDETKKDADSKLMTFVYAYGVSFVMDIKSQTTADDRCAEGIVSTHNRVVDPILDDGIKFMCYGTDNCNLMLKARSIIVAEQHVFGLGCFLHVQQNACLAVLKAETLAIQTTRENVRKLIDKLFNTVTLHVLRHYMGLSPNTKLGKPTSANTLEWMGELKKLMFVLDHKTVIKRTINDERTGGISIELANWFLTEESWNSMLLLETFQIIWYNNKLFLSRMYIPSPFNNCLI